MTKLEYLKQLEAGLRERMSEQEIYDIMRDYAEYFEEGKTEGKTEEEIITSLGSPSYVVSQILNEQDNPEMQAESDDIVGAAKEKFRRIKLRMEENKKYHQQKKQEKQNYQAKETYRGEYHKHHRPKKEKSNSGMSFLKVVVLIILWIFIIAPFLLSVFSAGAALVGCSVAGVCFLSVVSSFILPISNFMGIMGVLTILAAGITILLAAIMLLRFCIKKSLSSEEPAAQPVYETVEHHTQQSSHAEEEQKEEGDDQNA